MKPTYTLPFPQWQRLRRRAYAAQQKGLFEVAGLFARDPKNRIRLFFIENESQQPCHFEFDSTIFWQTRILIREQKLRYVGIFHSHPITEAQLGPSDIRNARPNSYQLLFDVCGTDAKLWKLRKQGRRKIPVEIPLRIERTVLRRNNQKNRARSSH